MKSVKHNYSKTYDICIIVIRRNGQYIKDKKSRIKNRYSNIVYRKPKYIFTVWSRSKKHEVIISKIVKIIIKEGKFIYIIK